MMTTESSGFIKFLIAQLNVVATRARLTVNEIDAIGAGLAAGVIDADIAIKWAAEIGIIDLIPDGTVIPSTSAA